MAMSKINGNVKIKKTKINNQQTLLNEHHENNRDKNSRISYRLDY